MNSVCIHLPVCFSWDILRVLLKLGVLSASFFFFFLVESLVKKGEKKKNELVMVTKHGYRFFSTPPTKGSCSPLFGSGQACDCFVQKTGAYVMFCDCHGSR